MKGIRQKDIIRIITCCITGHRIILRDFDYPNSIMRSLQSALTKKQLEESHQSSHYEREGESHNSSSVLHWFMVLKNSPGTIIEGRGRASCGKKEGVKDKRKEEMTAQYSWSWIEFWLNKATSRHMWELFLRGFQHVPVLMIVQRKMWRHVTPF